MAVRRPIDAARPIFVLDDHDLPRLITDGSIRAGHCIFAPAAGVAVPLNRSLCFDRRKATFRQNVVDRPYRASMVNSDSIHLPVTVGRAQRLARR